MVKKNSGKYADNKKRIMSGMTLASTHPLISPLPKPIVKYDGVALEMEKDAWIRMESEAASRYSTGYGEPVSYLWPNVKLRAAPGYWAYVYARACLHIVLGHIRPDDYRKHWHQACWFKAEEMLRATGIGKRPDLMPGALPPLPRRDERGLATYLAEAEPIPELTALSLGGVGQPFWTCAADVKIDDKVTQNRNMALARGVREAAKAAIDVAGGARRAIGVASNPNSRIVQAKSWVISEFPLLAALASSFSLIEDETLCDRMDVKVAAISDQTQEIYFNPKVSLLDDEIRFVMVHEFLHVGLRHTQRRQGRDPWYWNVACDYVINGWLLEMKVGTPPEMLGYLYDPELKGLSAEDIYDRIVSDLRWMRKLKKARTMNGANPDMMDGDHRQGWWNGGGADLDAFYRRALAQGLELHLGAGRGYLPAGLVEEIRSLMQPPIPWDVELAQWLDQYFPPLEKRRSYARAHRRQSATPDIVRPAWVSPEERKSARVFGAVIDTSGSMSRQDLGKAVGAIASYALSRDVSFVRLIQCDAAAFDAGYVEPETLLERVQVRGRGGTVLMPGIRMLEAADDFPNDGPILIITDGYCDRLTVKGDHAYLLADGGRMLHPTKGPVFRFK